jgi:Holliday junction resolvase RusA-like endonuclease
MFRVHGIPAPQGSKTAVVRGGRAQLLEGSSTTGRAAHKLWRSQVAEAATRAWEDQIENVTEPFDGPLAVAITFWCPAAKKHRGEYKPTKPDIDKLVRTVMDALATDARVMVDDSRVVELSATKRAHPLVTMHGAWIAVSEIEE